MRPTIVLATALALALAACGDDDDGGGGGAAGPYVDALVEEFDEGGDFPFDAGEARCLAAGFVDAVGAAELEAAGITPEEFAASDDPSALGVEFGASEAEALADTLGSCDLSVGELLIADEGSAGAEIPDGLVDCIDDNIEEDAFFDFFAASIVDEELLDEGAAAALFADLAEACPSFGELGAG